MPKQTTVQKRPALWRAGIGVVLVVLAVYALATHWHTVSAGLHVARGAQPSWVALSLILMAITFLIAAAIYGTLAFHRLRYFQTVLVEVSTAFVNRLLPSGIGGLGLHGVYLYKRKHTSAEATVVVSVNNLLGMVAHIVLLACVVAVRPEVIRELFRGHSISLPWQAVAILGVLLVMLFSLPKVRTKLLSFGRNMLKSVRRLRITALLRAVMLAMLLTATYTCILFASAASIGLHLGLLQIFIVFSIGMLVSTATPTPGGLVGAEAGLFAGFVAYNVTAADAAVAVLLYRLVTYWLPLLPGVLALALARQRRLL